MQKINEQNANSNRRDFLVTILKKTGQISIASSAIYTISLVSSDGAFGGLAAGAKTCILPKPPPSCGGGTPKRCGPGFTCNSSTGLWEDNSDCAPGPLCP